MQLRPVARPTGTRVLAARSGVVEPGYSSGIEAQVAAARRARDGHDAYGRAMAEQARVVRDAMRQAGEALRRSEEGQRRVQHEFERAMDRLRAEFAELRRENRKISKEQADAMVRAAFSALSSELGRYIQDENLFKNLKALDGVSPNAK